MSVSQRTAHQSWSKITGKVDGISCLPAKASADAEYQEEQPQWKPRPRCRELPLVAIILQRNDDKYQDRAGDEFVKEHASLRHVRLRVCAEYAGHCGLRGRYCANAKAFSCVDAVDIIDVYHSCRKETA